MRHEHVTHHGGDQRDFMPATSWSAFLPNVPERVTCGMRVGRGGARSYTPFWHLVTCKRCAPHLKGSE